MSSTVARLGLAMLLAAGAPAAAGAETAAARIVAIDVVGTAFELHLSDGRILSGPALAGATLTLTLAGEAAPQRVRLASIVADPADPEILFYDMQIVDPASGAESALCETEKDGTHWALPLKGQWDDEGKRISDSGITLVCALGGAIGKCVEWGYKPWKTLADGTSLAPYHQACIRMVRADYCGGHGTTSDGMTIDIADDLGINNADDAQSKVLGLGFEAAWNPDGALCVARTRVPANITLDGLRNSCPRLAGRIGPEDCIEGEARLEHYGRALLYSRTR